MVLKRLKSLTPIIEAEDSENENENNYKDKNSTDSLDASFESWELIGASSSDEEIKKSGRRLYKAED